jgi:hypothetical protein
MKIVASYALLAGTIVVLLPQMSVAGNIELPGAELFLKMEAGLYVPEFPNSKRKLH